MVTVDTHSHWMICTPCHEQASARESAILFHDDVIAPRGMPLSVTSDRDTRWRSVDGIWQQAIQMAGGAMRLTPAQHHHSNLVERSIRQLVEYNFPLYSTLVKNGYMMRLRGWPNPDSDVDFSTDDEMEEDLVKMRKSRRAQDIEVARKEARIKRKENKKKKHQKKWSRRPKSKSWKRRNWSLKRKSRV